MAAGETIHTENSHKYTPEAARLLLRAAGWEPLRSWTDGVMPSCSCSPKPRAARGALIGGE